MFCPSRFGTRWSLWSPAYICSAKPNCRRFERHAIRLARPCARDSAGNVPFNYQPDLLNPIGRTVMISIRKLFLPPPSFFRRQIEQRQQERQLEAPATPAPTR